MYMRNLIIQLTEFYIYRTKLNTQQVHLKALQNYLQENLVIEKTYIIKINHMKRQAPFGVPGHQFHDNIIYLYNYFQVFSLHTTMAIINDTYFVFSCLFSCHSISIRMKV